MTTSPHAAAPELAPRALVEPKADAGSSDIFIAPHVVDRVAFNEFAQRLRSLIDEASETAQSLRAATISAATIESRVTDQLERQSRQLAAAAKVLRAFDMVSRSAPLESHTHAHPSGNADPAQVEQQLGRVRQQIRASVDSAINEIERRSSSALASLQDRQVRLEARLDALARKERTITELLDTVRGELDSMSAKGRSLVALHCRVEDAIEQFAATHSASDSESDDASPSS